MAIRVPSLQTLIVAVLFCSPAVSQIGGGPTNVVVEPFTTRLVVVFDPTKPNGTPAGGANNLPGPPVDADNNPLVPPGLNAVTRCEVGFTRSGNTVTVTGVATIYVPTGNDRVLLGHERGHDFLCRREYNENALSKLTLATLAPMTFGSTLNDAAERGLDALSQQMDVIGDKFDQLTDRGRSPTVNTARAIRALLREREEARRQSVYVVPPGLPNPLRPWGGTADPPWVQFDPLTYRVSLGGDVLITHTNDMTDPIIGRGAFEFDPMALIGRDNKGIVHLADTGFRIRDLQTGLLLLDAYLLDVGYLDSTVAGYQGMIQASLDVPPEWAFGTSNPIGSQFIAGLADGSAAGGPTTFWFFTEQPLFELGGGGGGLIGQAGPVIGNLKAGFMQVAYVPEPSTAWLLLAALLVWLPPWAGVRQRVARHGMNT